MNLLIQSLPENNYYTILLLPGELSDPSLRPLDTLAAAGVAGNSARRNLGHKHIGRFSWQLQSGGRLYPCLAPPVSIIPAKVGPGSQPVVPCTPPSRGGLFSGHINAMKEKGAGRGPYFHFGGVPALAVMALRFGGGEPRRSFVCGEGNKFDRPKPSGNFWPLRH